MIWADRNRVTSAGILRGINRGDKESYASPAKAHAKHGFIGRFGASSLESTHFRNEYG
jgi:hypothetical protein